MSPPMSSVEDNNIGSFVMLWCFSYQIQTKCFFLGSIFVWYFPFLNQERSHIKFHCTIIVLQSKVKVLVLINFLGGRFSNESEYSIKNLTLNTKEYSASPRNWCLPWASKTFFGFFTEFFRMQTRDSHMFLLRESPTKTSRFPFIISNKCFPSNLET